MYWLSRYLFNSIVQWFWMIFYFYYLWIGHQNLNCYLVLIQRTCIIDLDHVFNLKFYLCLMHAPPQISWISLCYLKDEWSVGWPSCVSCWIKSLIWDIHSRRKFLWVHHIYMFTSVIDISWTCCAIHIGTPLIKKLLDIKDELVQTLVTVEQVIALLSLLVLDRLASQDSGAAACCRSLWLLRG